MHTEAHFTGISKAHIFHKICKNVIHCKSFVFCTFQWHDNIYFLFFEKSRSLRWFSWVCRHCTTNTSIFIDFLFSFGLKVVSVTFGCSSSFSLFFYICWSATTFPYHCMNFSLSLKIFLNSITILRSVQTFWDSKKEIISNFFNEWCCFYTEIVF